MGWPIECWDVSTAFLYARHFGDRDTDLGGHEIFMRLAKILVEVGVVQPGIVRKIKKALYGLRTSQETGFSVVDVWITFVFFICVFCWFSFFLVSGVSASDYDK